MKQLLCTIFINTTQKESHTLNYKNLHWHLSVYIIIYNYLVFLVEQATKKTVDQQDITL